MAVDIVKLYQEAEEASKNRKVSGTKKKDEVLKIVEQIAKRVGKKKLVLAALYATVKAVMEERGEKLERTYFAQLMKKNYKVEKDENGRLFVVLE